MKLKYLTFSHSHCSYLMLWFNILILICLFNRCLATDGTQLEYSIYEEQPPGSLVGNVKEDSNIAKPLKDEEGLLLRFSIRQSSPAFRYFTLDEVTGVVHTSQIIDRELICPYSSDCDLKLDIAVRPLKYFRIIKVSVKILDINDNSPTFADERVTVHVSETSPIGSLFLLPAAEDADSGSLGVKAYRLKSESDQFELKVTDQSDGSKDVRLRLIRQLDREDKGRHAVTVVASDGGRPPRTGSVVVDIVVVDANDNNPSFDKDTYQVEIYENTPALTTILQVHATDADEGPNGHVLYSLSELTQRSYGEQIGIVQESGSIFLKEQLDFEAVQTLHLTVLAVDDGPGSLPVSAKVTISVLDVNDNAPEISVNYLTSESGEGPGTAQVRENAPAGTFVAHIAVTDRDGELNGKVDCDIDEPILFQIDQLFNNEYKLTTRVVFDRELRDLYSVLLTCSDHGRPSLVSSTKIDVMITDINDHSPILDRQIFDVHFAESNPIGAHVYIINATDEDIGKNKALLYKIAPLNSDTPRGVLSIDPISGVVTANISFDYERRKQYEFLVTVSDHGDIPRSTTGTLILTITDLNDEPPKSQLTIEFLVTVSDHGDIPRTTTGTLILTITDLNDEPPKFDKSSYTFSVLEDSPLGTTVGRVFATDSDASKDYNSVTYDLEDTTGLFEINPGSGEIITARYLDREVKGSHLIVVVAFNSAVRNDPRHHHIKTLGQESRADVTVYIEDRNDNKPELVFPAPGNNIVQLRGGLTVPAGSLVTSIVAKDKDSGKNAELRYDISEGNAEGLFSISSLTGAITLKTELEAPAVGSDRIFRIVVLVTDRGDEPLSAFGELIIVVNNTLGPVSAAARVPEKESNIAVVAGVAVGVIVVICILAALIILIAKRRQRSNRNDKRAFDPYEGRRLSCRSCSQQLDHIQPIRVPSRSLLGLESDGSLTSYGRMISPGRCKCGMDAFGGSRHLCPLKMSGRGAGDGDEEDDEDSTFDHVPPVTFPLRNGDIKSGLESDTSDGGDRRAPLHRGPHMAGTPRRTRPRHHNPCCAKHPRRRNPSLRRTPSGKIPMQVTHFSVNDDTESACSCSDSGQGPSEEEGNRSMSSRNLRMQII